MGSKVPPKVINSKGVQGYDYVKGKIDPTKTQIIKDKVRVHTNSKLQYCESQHVRYEFFDSEGHSLMIQEEYLTSHTATKYGSNKLVNVAERSSIYMYTDENGVEIMAKDHNGDNVMDQVLTFDNQNNITSDNLVTRAGTLKNNNKVDNMDGSYSLYAKDENGNIIADHYKNGKFSHSTGGSNPYNKPYGIKLGDPSYNKYEQKSDWGL